MKRYGFVAIIAAALTFAVGQALTGMENGVKCTDHSSKAVSGACEHHADAGESSCCGGTEKTATTAVHQASGSGDCPYLSHAALEGGDKHSKGHAQGKTEEKKGTVKAQSHCPVMGGEIDRKLFADYKGKRVYFCCAMCTSKFEKDPEKYIKQLEDEGVVVEKTPEA